MGSFHGAEICELVGLFLLDQLKTTFDVGMYGIYRDDGLAVVDKITPCQQERLTKRIRKVFQTHDFKITINKGMMRTEFLDVILDLKNNCHRPYKKPNTELTYVSNHSNHPNSIKRQIPKIISKRLSQLSSDKSTFNSTKMEYQDALKKCNYKEDIKFDEEIHEAKKKRKRKRNIIYFQPPFCATVKTPIGRKFLNLVKKHFNINHPLYKILNPKCIKMSYSCLPNVKTRIAGNNKKILSHDSGEPENMCNCRKKNECPVNNKCLTRGVIYKAEITDKKGETNEYIGSTGNTFKERYNQHTATMREKRKKDLKKNSNENPEPENPDDGTEEKGRKKKKEEGIANKKEEKKKKLEGTALSRHFWVTKKADGTEPTIKWTIMTKTKAMPNEKNGCTLCNLERLAIAKANKERSLNVRRELSCMCPHFVKSFFKKPK